MHRVSGVDAAFLYGETASWHMHVSAALLVEPSDAVRPFTFESFCAHIARRVHLAPQFQWRLIEVPLGLDRPFFVDDPDFDVNAHLNYISVPSPGDSAELGHLIGDLVARKLDRSRPLWEMWFIHGLADGRVAILAKVHHAIVDGITGSELAMLLMDLEPDPPTPVPPEQPAGSDVIPDITDLVIRGVVSAALTPVRVAQFMVQTARQGARLVPFRRRETPPPVPFQAPRVSFNAELTPHRRFAYTGVPLADVRRIKDHCGVKVNDVVLALCAGALRRYLVDRRELPGSPLIAQVPVSMRVDGDHDAGTKVGAMFASLATNVDDPMERLMVIAEGTRNAKEMQQALAADKIMGISETAPPGLIDLAARMYTLAGLDRGLPPLMNTIISNVPGPAMPIWCAGSPVEAFYPMGPLLYGTGLNVTVFSYGASVDFGFLVCPELVPQPWRLVDGVHEALAELVAACDNDPAAI
jgi:diacylglycerol O-acyltransferase / wax synthase